MLPCHACRAAICIVRGLRVAILTVACRESRSELRSDPIGQCCIQQREAELCPGLRLDPDLSDLDLPFTDRSAVASKVLAAGSNYNRQPSKTSFDDQLGARLGSVQNLLGSNVDKPAATEA